MRWLIAGSDADGHSCVVQQAQFADPRDAPTLQTIFKTALPPPGRPPATGSYLDLRIPPGRLAWARVELKPGHETDRHHTDSVDLDIIVAGSVELLLDDGAHVLEPGDCVVVGGVDHGWRAGPDGCTSSVIAIGTPPPEAGTVDLATT
jgi:quercetin dioxygenase-like cupin family protein